MGGNAEKGILHSNGIVTTPLRKLVWK